MSPLSISNFISVTQKKSPSICMKIDKRVIRFPSWQKPRYIHYTCVYIYVCLYWESLVPFAVGHRAARDSSGPSIPPPPSLFSPIYINIRGSRPAEPSQARRVKKKTSQQNSISPYIYRYTYSSVYIYIHTGRRPKEAEQRLIDLRPTRAFERNLYNGSCARGYRRIIWHRPSDLFEACACLRRYRIRARALALARWSGDNEKIRVSSLSSIFGRILFYWRVMRT